MISMNFLLGAVSIWRSSKKQTLKYFLLDYSVILYLGGGGGGRGGESPCYTFVWLYLCVAQF